ncbi:MAG: hypothetical protein M1274_15070 [Actinobacteria bacterium]|nr:hypothetical protein [Actinomycetota bacterium]
MKIHAVIHAVVENQLALEEPVVVATFTRLWREGLDRRDALHAVGSVPAVHVHSMFADEQSPTRSQPNEEYHKALRKLSAAKWRTS